MLLQRKTQLSPRKSWPSLWQLVVKQNRLRLLRWRNTEKQKWLKLLFQTLSFTHANTLDATKSSLDSSAKNTSQNGTTWLEPRNGNKEEMPSYKTHFYCASCGKWLKHSEAKKGKVFLCCPDCGHRIRTRPNKYNVLEPTYKNGVMVRWRGWKHA